MKACGRNVIVPAHCKKRKPCRPKPSGNKRSCKTNDKSHCRKPGSKSRFVEHIFPAVTAGGSWHCLPAQKTANMSVYSYAIVNKSGTPVDAVVEISPNAVDYAKDVQQVVAGGGKTVIVPLRFLKYTRLCVKAKNPSETAHIQVYYQGQLR